ncbi:hypothetical protein BpHYR1_010465 [Brachionus plicatilis]|uniref:Uncharacterized protein n=1 Tax=Brachionus plicatilis TaxID=10195 RepID=A0A3M7SLK2_BRAPC|nr:hypothetical protein BpHYR1_010465 [Brachionus plicatilis]
MSLTLIATSLSKKESICVVIVDCSAESPSAPNSFHKSIYFAFDNQQNTLELKILKISFFYSFLSSHC